MRIPFLAWVFLVPLLVILVGIDVALVSAQCLSGQQDLLLQLKDSLRFDQSKSTKLASWNTSIDCCNWNGIKCDGGGHVTGLNLSSESITGGIANATALFNLSSLHNLDLSFNNFSTTLPVRFANLTELTHLNLSNAGFTGQIPFEISQLTNLVTLDLSILYFPGVIPLKLENPKLVTFVQKFTQLRQLHLDGVNISTQGSEWCKALSSSLPRLEVLSLSNCFLSGPIDPSFAQLQSLRVIHLGNNNLSSPVPDFFGNFSNLIALHLGSCELNGVFPESVFQPPNLEILDLADNKLLQGHLPEIIGCNSLKTLLLSNTKFSGSLPLSVGKFKNLSRIELAACNFTGPIPSTMDNLTQLAYLDFSANNFAGPVPSFRMAKNLTYIDFSNNSLTGEISSIHWDILQNLVYFDLQGNSLNGSIPSSMFAIPSLKQIMLSFNQFGGKLPNLTNASSSSLDTLDLRSNKLEGSIPMSVFDLPTLSVLSLSYNKFNGTIKLEWFQKLKNLTTLDLSYNSLTVDANPSNSSLFSFIKTLKLASCNLREFPVLDKQSGLSYLDFSNNLIKGVIPRWIWEVGNGSLQHLNLSGNLLVGLEEHRSIPRLSLLDLSHNQLQGNIPLPPRYAIIVDYSNNKFNSSIPTDIGNYLSFSIFFSLSNNSLTGAIPQTICNASYLEVLDLSSNNLTGTIPSCLMEKINTLGVLNLRRNRFNGSIPDQFPESCALKTLDLSGNHLGGGLPRSLANCSMLEVLNLGNNKIEDIFPCYLKKNTSTLRVLALRNNNFYGRIGCPGVNATWPRLLIMDLSFNNFSGNLSGKCFSTWKAMMGSGNERFDHLKFKTLILTEVYYQDSITVTLKGFVIELVKILTVFTSIDFSQNKIEGPIPEELGQLRALYVLNISHNALSGQIPAVLGNLSQLESLDLSFNNLSGTIPKQLARLYFLSFLNLSYNQLVGMIPRGNQLQTFDELSYVGNTGLCGKPLTENCNDGATNSTPTPQVMRNQRNGHEYDWQYIATGLGFGAGAGAVVAPLLFRKKANKWYDDRIDKILLVVLPLLGLRYYTRGDWRRHWEDAFSENDTEIDEEEEEGEDEDEDEIRGRYCVYCTKLDIARKLAIHDRRCTCYHSPPLSSSSSYSSSSLSS